MQILILYKKYNSIFLYLIFIALFSKRKFENRIINNIFFNLLGNQDTDP